MAIKGLKDSTKNISRLRAPEEPKHEVKKESQKPAAKEETKKGGEGIILATRVPADFFEEWRLYSTVKAGGKKGAKSELLVTALQAYMNKHPLTEDEKKAGAILSGNR